MRCGQLIPTPAPLPAGNLPASLRTSDAEMAADDPVPRLQPYNRRLLAQLEGTSSAVSLDAAAVGQLCEPQLAGWLASLDASGLRLTPSQQQRQQVVEALVADAQALADEVSREHGLPCLAALHTRKVPRPALAGLLAAALTGLSHAPLTGGACHPRRDGGARGTAAGSHSGAGVGGRWVPAAQRWGLAHPPQAPPPALAAAC